VANLRNLPTLRYDTGRSIASPVQEPSRCVVRALADAGDATAQGLHVADRHLVRLVHGPEDARRAQQQGAALAPMLRPAAVRELLAETVLRPDDGNLSPTRQASFACMCSGS